MSSIELGKLINQPQGFKAFIPNPFPPKDGFRFDPKILKKNEEATRLLERLDSVTKLLPDTDLFLLMYLRKDAASSSQIEGTLATMINAIEVEAEIKENIPKDVDDILHYIKALNYGIKRTAEDGFPLALRFIKELHRELLRGARSTHFSDPGEFRRTQNWLGGTRPDNARFVPPPVKDMQRAMFDLEKFINTSDTIPIIIKSGLIHAQFETIHPFLDGNGRTGRMLITFYLRKEGFLEKPVLFLSSYFKKHQQTYYAKLFGYHYKNITDWLDFFLDGVIKIAEEAIVITSKITTLRHKDMERVAALGKRAAESTMTVLQRLYAQPIVNRAMIQKWTKFTRSGTQRVIDRLVHMGILIPADKKATYRQYYIYKKYLDIFTVDEQDKQVGRYWV